MRKQGDKIFEELYEKYEGTARWGSLIYTVLVLAKHFLFGKSLIVSIILDTAIFMVFSLGLRRIALNVCSGNEPLAREYFWAFESPFFIWNVIVGVCVAILFNLPMLFRMKLPYGVSGAARVVLCLYVELFSFLMTRNPGCHFCKLFPQIWVALKKRQGMIRCQICLLFRYAVPYLAVCLVILLMAYDANKNALRDIDALSDSFAIIYAVYAFVVGPKFFLKNNYNLLQIVDKNCSNKEF